MGLFSRKKSIQSSGVQVESGWVDDGPRGFVVLDLETTGLSPDRDRIIEFALIQMGIDGQPLGYWSSLVNPGRSVGATEIHGIRDGDVQGFPTFAAFANEVVGKIRDHAIVAHNAAFDISFLSAELSRLGLSLPELPAVCTMQESRYFLPGLERKRLSDCASAVGIEQPTSHRALDDASVTAALFHFYLNGPVNPIRSEELKTIFSLGSKQTTVLTFRGKGSATSASKHVLNPVVLAAEPSDILKRVGQIMPEDLVGNDAGPTNMGYAELLLEVIEDGQLTADEVIALEDFATSVGLSSETVVGIHKLLLSQLAQEAWRDGSVSRAEQQGVVECARQLGLSEADGKAALKDVEDFRAARVAARVKVLPEDWTLGSPLRIGDRVVITGCYERGRYDLEAKAKKLGVRITSAVSGRTNLLVSDGTINGNKDADALRLGIRVVGPDDFRALLEFIQPAEEPGQNSVVETRAATAIRSSNPETESLICVQCGSSFVRTVAKGRKPHRCPACR